MEPIRGLLSARASRAYVRLIAQYAFPSATTTPAGDAPCRALKIAACV